MTATAEPETLVETGELLVRSFDAAIEAGDGRTLDIRLAPYNTPAIVADPPTYRPYQELFEPGAFERQVGAPDRVSVWLNFEHDGGLRGIVGHGLALHDSDQALEGSFRVHENPDGDKALQLVRDGLLTGASLEFVPQRSRRVDGVVHRLRAHIDKVSLCREPAYTGAQVLAVREQPHDVDEDALEPAPSAPLTRSVDVDERLARLGVETLHRISVVKSSWDGSPGRFTDEQYQRSALFCRPGDDPPKQRCSLPVLEPGGALNANALGAAAAALAGARGGLANVTAAQKAAAARKLIRYYGAAGMDPPPSLRALASG